MSMSRKLVLVLSVSALFMGPVAPVFDPTDLGAAYAKGGNGGGNGGGNKGGNSSNAGSGNGSKGGNAKSSDKKGETSVETASTEEAPEGETGGKPAKGSKAKGQAASSLGNMNGALNASPNAIRAHMRNGNFSGPVGRMAALSVADSAAAGVDVAAVRDAKAAYDAYQSQVAAALAEAGYDSLQEYLDERERYEASLTPPTEEVPAEGEMPVAEDALAESETPPAEEPVVEEPAEEFVYIDLIEQGGPAAPSEEELAAAQGVVDAEAAILENWNKNPDADPATISAEEQALLDAARARIGALGLVASAN